MPSAQQSPINLANPYFTEFRKNHLQIKWKKSVQGTITVDDHGVRVEFGGDQRQYAILDRKRFHLVQFHFHHPSEHWIDGKQQTMELHVVHQNIDDGSRLVIGIFIDSTDKATGTPDLVPKIREFMGHATAEAERKVVTNPLSFLPKDTSHYYFYEGSLTTPEYDENVSWVIFKDALQIPKSEVVSLIKAFRHPARLPQPLCRRFVLANFKA